MYAIYPVDDLKKSFIEATDDEQLSCIIYILQDLQFKLRFTNLEYHDFLLKSNEFLNYLNKLHFERVNHILSELKETK